MIDLFFLLLFFPIAWPFVARMIWHCRITWLEMGLNIAIVAALMSIVWFSGRYSATADVEIWNGEVVKTDVWRFSCPTNTSNPCTNGYSCNCVTHKVCSGSGSNETCTTYETCDTCYTYPWEQNWYARTNIGDVEIARVDAQGAVTPPRWSQIRPGDPVADARSFTNWVKGAAHSLFNEEQAALTLYADRLPAYPARIYDYYRIDRVVDPDGILGDLQPWNEALSLTLRRLGPEKQANAVIVVTKAADPMYARALEAHWLGGKKNDVVLVIGAPEAPTVAWAHVFSWSRHDMMNVSLRDRVLAIGTLDRAQILAALDETVRQYFERRPMSEFEYLKDEIEPPTWVLVLAALFAFLLSPALTWWFWKNDIHDEKRPDTDFDTRLGRR